MSSTTWYPFLGLKVLEVYKVLSANMKYRYSYKQTNILTNSWIPNIDTACTVCHDILGVMP